MTKWGPLGETTYLRTYSRRKPDGSSETWEETVDRVVQGNIALVHPDLISDGEAADLKKLFLNFHALPAGRFLWVQGVEGRQWLYNCHRAGWGENLADHFCFVFSELMKGGGVGSNYSTSYLSALPIPKGSVDVRVVATASHDDWEEVAPLLSSPSAGEAVYRVPDSREGWISALRLIFDTAELGGGTINIDVSDVRPRGSLIKGFGGTASGPTPLASMLNKVAKILNRSVGKHLSTFDCLDIDQAIAECVVAGNVRRSARMSCCHWAQEDILDFINLKADTGSHWSTNISVEVDQDFFDALDKGDPHASAVFEAVVDGMLTNGEPGFFNSTAASVGETGDVRCTNPCGEIALEAEPGVAGGEPCLIGSVNLGALGMRYGEIISAAWLLSRFLLRATLAPIEDPGQRSIVERNRRIGVGLYGWTEFLAAHKCKYENGPDSITVKTLLNHLHKTIRETVQVYARELDIPEPIKVTSIQPTGTTSLLSGHTAGIHPPYSRYYLRRVRFADNDPELAAHIEAGREIEKCQYSENTSVVVIPTKDKILEDYDESLIQQADEIDLGTMLRTQAFVQREYADNAVSFTCNVPPGTSRSELADALRRWLPELKGTTVMVDNSRPQAPYTRIDKDTYESLSGSVTGQALADCATGACPVR